MVRRRRPVVPLLVALSFCAASWVGLPAGPGRGWSTGPAAAHAEKGKKVKNAFKRFGQAIKKGAKTTAGALKGKGKSGGGGGAKK